MNRIKELRQNMGITMKEAAANLGLPYTTYVNYEKGVREPNSETLIDLANFYQSSVDYLIGRSAEQSGHPPSTPAPPTVQCETPDECDLVLNYRQLNPSGKEYIRQTISITLQAYSEKNDAVSELETAQ
jgi:transcriptional regulator with XRE-family HTH domain